MRLLPFLLAGACTSEGLRSRPHRDSSVDDPGTELPPGTLPGCGSAGSESEGVYVPQGTAADFSGTGCVTAVHATAGAAGSVLALTFEGDRPLRVGVTDPGGRVLLTPTDVAPGETVEVEPEVSGELLVRLAPAAPADEPWSYALDVACAEGCARQYTRYPLLLMHGMGGAESFDGVDYFVGVEDELGAAGVVVSAPGVSPFANSLDRALEWEVELDLLLARGHRRVNLFGHSQGGSDARVLASDVGLARGDQIASVTTLGTPHHGTPVADLVLTAVVDGVIEPWALDLGAGAFATLFGLDASDPALTATLTQLSTPVAEALDQATPDHLGTEYASWAGYSCGVLEPICQDQHDGEVVGGLLATTYLLLWPTPNDGMPA